MNRYAIALALFRADYGIACDPEASTPSLFAPYLEMADEYIAQRAFEQPDLPFDFD